MTLKQIEMLSRADFDEAVVRLRMNVSEIAKETGIPRTYLSEFRNGDRKLRPENLAKLRDYFEGKGIQFDNAEPAASDDDAVSPHPRLEAVKGTRCYFPIADTVSDEMVGSAMDMMEENDARLVTLLKEKAERNDGFFGDGNFTEETQAALQETFALLAANYIVFRMLRGWRAFGVKPATEDPQTLRDVLQVTFGKQLADAGLIEQASLKEGSAKAKVEVKADAEEAEA